MARTSFKLVVPLYVVVSLPSIIVSCQRKSPSGLGKHPNPDLLVCDWRLVFESARRNMTSLTRFLWFQYGLRKLEESQVVISIIEDHSRSPSALGHGRWMGTEMLT